MVVNDGDYDGSRQGSLGLAVGAAAALPKAQRAAVSFKAALLGKDKVEAEKVRAAALEVALRQQQEQRLAALRRESELQRIAQAQSAQLSQAQALAHKLALQQQGIKQQHGSFWGGAPPPPPPPPHAEAWGGGGELSAGAHAFVPGQGVVAAAAGPAPPAVPRGAVDGAAIAHLAAGQQRVQRLRAASVGSAGSGQSLGSL